MYQPLVSRLSIMAGGTDEASDESIGGGRYAYYYANDVDVTVDADAIELFGLPIENTSHQCSSPMMNLACHPDDKPLWWLVLRWMKMMLLKIARSYHAKPLLLVFAPLFFGIAIGFWLGRWQSLSQPQRRIQQTIKKKNQAQEQQHEHEHEHEQLLNHLRVGRLTEWLSVLWFRLSVVATYWFSQDITTTTCMKGISVRENSPMTATPVASNIIPISNCEDENDIDDSDSLSKSNYDDKKTSVNSGLEIRENKARNYLNSDTGTVRESGVPVDRVPRHVAVIMDGNRRYGKSKYGSAARGHWDGSSKLVEFAKWCIAEKIAVLTVFAFSSENWKRDPAEVASLMQIFAKYCDELRVEAIERNIKIMVLSTDYEKIPAHVRVGVKRMVEETQHCDGMIMNICLSYGSRGEIVGAAKSLVEDVLQRKLDPNTIDENTIGERLLTHNCGGDPDVLIRTSGELRISNFLLWQLAYTEFFFVDKPWPAIDKDDLLGVIRTYAKGRTRRYGE